MTVLVRCDYLGDLRRLLSARLVADGFAVDAGDDAEAVLLKYLNVQQRGIPPGARQVQWSRELRTREPSLPPNLRAVIDTIEQASVRGENLSPYLSRRLVRAKDADFTDPLDNDWGMKHMHLGDAEESPGVIKGTRELLFVIVRADTLYLIEVGKHGDWVSQRLFDIAESNWPELFAHAAMNGISGDNLSEETRRVLRKKFAMGTTVAGGKVYIAPGGGQAASGLNFELRRVADQLLNRIHALEEAHKSQGEEIAAKIERKTGRSLGELHLQLHDVAAGGEITVVEVQTNIGLKSSMTIECAQCPTAVQATREAALSLGWTLVAALGWVCPNCGSVGD